MHDPIVPMIAFIATIVVSQIIVRRAHANLTAEQKIALMNSSGKIPWTLVMIALAYGMQAWLADRMGHPSWGVGAFMIVLMLLLVASLLWTLRRFRQLGLPAGYIRIIIVTQICTFAVLGFLFWGSYRDIKELNETTSRILQESKRE